MKVLVIGCSRMSGIGKESGRPYDFASITYLKELEPVTQEKFQLAGYGYETGKADLAIEALPRFKDVKFPAWLELQVTSEPGRQGLKTVVCGFTVAVDQATQKPVLSKAA